MREMTKKFLLDAFAGESQAHMKYYIFAEEAEKKGLSNLANLFRAISHAEYVHAKNHFVALGLLGNTAENIKSAYDGEEFEVNEMYPVYNETSKLQGESSAARSTHYALEAEKLHMNMYDKALKLAESGKDYDEGTIYICPVCGYTSEKEAPEKCPVCGVPHDKFKKFEA